MVKQRYKMFPTFTGLTGLDSDAFGKGQAAGIRFKQRKKLNGENVDSPAYAMAIAA